MQTLGRFFLRSGPIQRYHSVHVQSAPDDLQRTLGKDKVDEMLATKKTLFAAYAQLLEGVSPPPSFAAIRTDVISKSTAADDQGKIACHPDASRPLTLCKCDPKKSSGNTQFPASIRVMTAYNPNRPVARSSLMALTGPIGLSSLSLSGCQLSTKMFLVSFVALVIFLLLFFAPWPASRILAHQVICIMAFSNDAEFSSGNIWNEALGSCFHFLVGPSLQDLLAGDELDKIALSSRFALHTLCDKSCPQNQCVIARSVSIQKAIPRRREAPLLTSVEAPLLLVKLWVPRQSFGSLVFQYKLPLFSLWPPCSVVPPLVVASPPFCRLVGLSVRLDVYWQHLCPLSRFT